MSSGKINNTGLGWVQWLDATFNSRSKTESLLRPELESGNITERDYTAAANFFPGYHRYYPYMDGAGVTSVAALGMYYRARQRKVPISQPRLVIVTSLAYFVGAVFGQARRAAAHINFVRGLEDRDRFMQALQNIYQRETGEIPAVGPARTVDIHGDSKQPVDTPWTPESAAASPNNLPAVPPTPNQAQPPPSNAAARSRWDEIRAANARGAPTSSWDALRQQHERANAPDNVRRAGADESAAGFTDPDQERAQEQARFDAILEAERKMARG